MNPKLHHPVSAGVGGENQPEYRRLFLRGLTRQVAIGVHAFERENTQRIIFDIDIYVCLDETTPQNDCIDEVVDYDFVRVLVSQLIERGHIDLQETLCDGIVAGLLTHPKVLSARVSTRKPDVYDDCEAVGVEVYKTKLMRT